MLLDIYTRGGGGGAVEVCNKGIQGTADNGSVGKSLHADTSVEALLQDSRKEEWACFEGRRAKMDRLGRMNPCCIVTLQA